MRQVHEFGIGAAVKQQVERVRSRMKRMLGNAGRKPADTSNSTNEAAYREMPADKKVFHFFGHYRAPACPCRLALFLAKDHYEDQPHKPLLDPRLDWTKVAGHGFEVHEIPGNHVTINEEPHVRVLAGLLSECLAKAPA